MFDFLLIFHSLPFLFKGMWTTLQIACAAIAIGMCGGLVIGVVNCRKMELPTLQKIFKTCVWVIRGTPLFVQVLIVYYALPEVIHISFTPFMAGVIALGFNSATYISEIVRGGINAIPDGQWEAAHVLGLKPLHTLKGIILPQMLRISLPSLTNELTTLIKETSILMVIGVGELTKVSKDIVARELDPMGIYLTAALLYLTMTSTIALFNYFIQKRWQI